MDIKYIIKEKMNFNIQELTDFQEQNKKPGKPEFYQSEGNRDTWSFARWS